MGSTDADVFTQGRRYSVRRRDPKHTSARVSRSRRAQDRVAANWRPLSRTRSPIHGGQATSIGPKARSRRRVRSVGTTTPAEALRVDYEAELDAVIGGTAYASARVPCVSVDAGLGAYDDERLP